MKPFIALLLTALFHSCNALQPSFTPLPQQKLQGKASYVIDGSTFYFSFDKGKFKANLAGTHVPSMKEKYGRESFEFLHKLINQKDVQIEYLKTDAQGRWIVNAFLEGNLNVQEKVQAFQASLPSVPDGHPPLPKH